MSQTLCILGRQPALGLAELESLYGSDVLRPVGQTAALLAVDPQHIDFSRLGGTVKFCKVLTTIDSSNWGDIQKFLAQAIPEHLQYLPDGKLKLGLSVFGLKSVSVQRLHATALELKKIIKRAGRSVRVIPNKELALNSAQVLHNQLTGNLGWELVFVADGQRTILAQNIAEQDIDAYSLRDRERPKRDSRVGMLPPKLAQIIINLGAGLQPTPSDSSSEACSSLSSINFDKTVLDPFCGTGVLLQESLMMGYEAYGTDLEPRMIEYSDTNLKWLQTTIRPIGTSFRLEVADATSYEWSHKKSFIACETYLGRALTTLPSEGDLQQIVQDCNYIHKKFLLNLARQVQPGFRACIAVPTWRTKNGFKHMPVLDQLTDLGYTRMSFVHAAESDLVYHRDDQVVGRELVILSRN
jgi:SAM-dependent methyltransferase